MSEQAQPIRELPDSIIPRARETTGRVVQAVHLVSKSVTLEMADTALDPRGYTDEARAEMEGLGEELIGLANDSLLLLKEMVDSGAISLELNESGFPLRLMPADIGRRALEAGAAHPPQPPHPLPTAPERHRPKKELPPLSVIIKGQEFDGSTLGLTNLHEVEILKIMATLNTDDPLVSKMFYDRGFGANAKNDVSRQSAFSAKMPNVQGALATAAGEDALTRARNGKGYEYFVLVPMVIDGQQVPVTVKKN